MQPEVLEIFQEMIRGTYTAKTLVNKAHDWGVTEKTAREYAAVAAREWRATIDVEELRVELLCRIDQIAIMAKKEGKFGPALDALKFFAEVHGLLKPPPKPPALPPPEPKLLPPPRPQMSLADAEAKLQLALDEVRRRRDEE